jgi:hypothetical protein
MGALETINGVATRVFNVTSYSAVNASVLTINGDGTGDPVVFNFAFGSNVNLGGSVVLGRQRPDDPRPSALEFSIDQPEHRPYQ